MNYQAGQARNEKSRREALEQQFQNYKHETAQKEQRWQSYTQTLGGRNLQLEKTLELRQQEIAEQRKQLAEKDRQIQRVADIPAQEILRKVGVQLKEAKPNVFARISEKNGQNLYFATGNKVFDTDGKIVAANAIEVAKIICRADKSTAPDQQQENQRAARFLVKHFGEERAEAAVLFAHRENHREDIKNYNLALEKAA